jgi:hypothetical protein
MVVKMSSLKLVNTRLTSRLFGVTGDLFQINEQVADTTGFVFKFTGFHSFVLFLSHFSAEFDRATLLPNVYSYLCYFTNFLFLNSLIIV